MFSQIGGKLDVELGESPAQCAARIGPFFEFDPTRLNGYRYWPQGAAGNKTTGAITYFRAENGAYNIAGGTTTRSCPDSGETTPADHVVYPAKLVTTSGTTTINPKSFQIFSSGLGLRYGKPIDNNWLIYPGGDNYDIETFDDIANFFTNGTLEDAQP